MAVPLDLEHLYTVVCRPALPKDTADVLEFTRKIWDGNDYLPSVWEDWLQDPLGILVAAEYGGKVVGVGKLSFMAPGEWWLEGLRVNPDYQGQKIASHLHEYLVEMWEKHCDGILRLSTTSTRYPVHHLCERTGFYRRAEMTWFAADSLLAADKSGNDEEKPVLVQEGEVARVLDFLWNNPIFQLSDGLVDRDWHWENLRPEHIEMSVAEKLAFWLHGAQSLLVLARDTDEEGEFTHILAAGSSIEDLPDMLHKYRQIAGRLGFMKAFWSVPIQPGPLSLQVIAFLNEAGFKTEWDFTIYIFEKPKPGE